MLGAQLSIPCPSGTIGNFSGLTDGSECTPCPPGYYCSTPGLLEPTGPCSPGYYCDGGADRPNPSHGGDICPSGFFCPQSTHIPIACPTGTYLPREGAHNISDCISCPTGFFCNSSGLQIPSGACEAGYFCTMGASTASPTDILTGDICPLGSFCIRESSLPLLCPDWYLH